MGHSVQIDMVVTMAHFVWRADDELSLMVTVGLGGIGLPAGLGVGAITA